MFPAHALLVLAPAVLAKENADGVNMPYNYNPTQWTAIVFLALFGVSAALHAGQAFYYRMWWLLPTVCLAGALEVLGWSARLWSSISPTLLTPFEIQITATIIAPTPLVAANFVILGRIIERLGASYSRLSPKWYTIIFCTGDFVSLVVQGAGGGLAASATGNNKDPTPGGNVMLGGIIFQMATMSVYVLCATEFLVRFFKNRPLHSAGRRGALTPGLRCMLAAMVFNTTCLFIRAVYRTIELSDGWEGRIISTQRYFNILDGAMITLAIFTLNFFHPGVLLRNPEPGAEGDEKGV